MLVASLAGFEPATRCLEGSRSIQPELQGQASHSYSSITGVGRQEGGNINATSLCPLTLRLLPHTEDGQPEIRQAGDNRTGNQYTDKNGQKGMLEFQPEKYSRQ